MIQRGRRFLVVVALSLAGAAMLLAGPGTAAAAPNPPGNNGTIKLDDTTFDDHPNNEPHVGCVFQVDFYGYDEGDLDATVTFEAHPPTLRAGEDQVLLTDTVFIGEDDNSGGGSEAGLDASATYTLDLSGITPHPTQGFHVKLTINAEGSQGADVKHKVFWVTGCVPGPHHHHLGGDDHDHGRDDHHEGDLHHGGDLDLRRDDHQQGDHNNGWRRRILLGSWWPPGRRLVHPGWRGAAVHRSRQPADADGGHRLARCGGRKLVGWLPRASTHLSAPARKFVPGQVAGGGARRCQVKCCFGAMTSTASSQLTATRPGRGVLAVAGRRAWGLHLDRGAAGAA